jgi:hypothetical protein
MFHPRGASGDPDDQDKRGDRKPTHHRQRCQHRQHRLPRDLDTAVENNYQDWAIRERVSDADNADATSARLPLICVPRKPAYDLLAECAVQYDHGN